MARIREAVCEKMSLHLHCMLEQVVLSLSTTISIGVTSDWILYYLRGPLASAVTQFKKGCTHQSGLGAWPKNQTHL